ncbi:MAG: DUF4432 family protein [Clostridia bacterium]|nr:DUF4432 family protein [Clostridia bacterium]
MERREFLDRCGRPSFIQGVIPFIYDDGRGKGVSAYRVRTGTGLDFTVLRDRGLDLFECAYKGVNLCFISRNGLVSPENASDDLNRSLSGGLLFTAGLTNTGRPAPGYPAHGRLHRYPANLPYAKEGDVIEIGGDVYDSTLDDTLCLHRKIEAKDNEIAITDVVENQNPRDTQFAILYHMNLGFPFADEHAEIKFDAPYKVFPFFDVDKETVGTHKIFEAPADVPERNYLLDVEAESDGFSTVRVENKKLGLGVYFRAKKDTLPYFNEWKSLTPGLYTLAIEPSNTRLRGIAEEKEMKTLKAYGKAEHKVIFGVYEL